MPGHLLIDSLLQLFDRFPQLADLACQRFDDDGGWFDEGIVGCQQRRVSNGFDDCLLLLFVPQRVIVEDPDEDSAISLLELVRSKN